MSTKTAIVGLGRGVWDDGTLTPDSLAVATRVSALFASGGYDFVVFSGRFSFRRANKPKTEARAMGEEAERRGIPKEKILIEETSRDTIGNALYTKQLLRKMSCTHLTVAACSPQIERAMYIFGRVLGKSYDIVPEDVEFHDDHEAELFDTTARESVSQKIVEFELDCIEESDPKGPKERFEKICKGIDGIVKPEKGENPILFMFRNPEVMEVRKEQWEEHGMNENIIVLPEKRGNSYTFYVNMDFPLLAKVKKDWKLSEKDAALLDQQYKYAMTLFTLYTLMLQNKEPDGRLNPKVIEMSHGLNSQIAPYLAQLFHDLKEDKNA